MLRLHRNGRFRRWLGGLFGRDAEFGDRLWRRMVHAAGALVLVYFPFPSPLFGVVPKLAILLALFGTLLVLEALRHRAGLELPAMRSYERHRLASYVFYGAALTVAVVLFPLPVAVTVVLGTAWVDPLIGEVRASARWRRTYPLLPFGAYVGLALVGLVGAGRWPLEDALALGAAAGALALAVERPRLPWMDDDLAMTVVPALFLWGVGIVALGLPA